MTGEAVSGSDDQFGLLLCNIAKEVIYASDETLHGNDVQGGAWYLCQVLAGRLSSLDLGFLLSLMANLVKDAPDEPFHEAATVVWAATDLQDALVRRVPMDMSTLAALTTAALFAAPDSMLADESVQASLRGLYDQLGERLGVHNHDEEEK